MAKIYVMGSLKNPRVVALAALLEENGHEAFADWYSPGPDADQFWQEYETLRGRTYLQAINGPHAWNVCLFDKRHLDWADTGILVCPAGKSAHTELGYMIGRNKRTCILLDGEPERWDIMYRLASHIVDNDEDLLKCLSTP